MLFPLGRGGPTVQNGTHRHYHCQVFKLTIRAIVIQEYGNELLCCGLDQGRRRSHIIRPEQKLRRHSSAKHRSDALTLPSLPNVEYGGRFVDIVLSIFVLTDLNLQTWSLAFSLSPFQAPPTSYRFLDYGH